MICLLGCILGDFADGKEQSTNYNPYIIILSIYVMAHQSFNVWLKWCQTNDKMKLHGKHTLNLEVEN